MKIYADNAATTALDSRALDKMIPYLKEHYGNASSVYSIGQEAKKALEDARATVAAALSADTKEIYFTGSGSESDNWALKGAARANRVKGNHIISTKIEHHAVLHSLAALGKEGFEITYLNVDKDGFISLDELKASIKDTTILISVMFANNEIGTIEPVAEIGKIANEHKILFHTDAVQAAGHCIIDIKQLNVDLLSISAHKFYGPKGVGALYIKKGTKIDNFIDGGAQENKRRAGTENVAGIVGMAEALRISTEALKENSEKTRKLRDALIAGLLKIPHCRLNGSREQRLDNNVNISFEHAEGESILLMLDMNGICASSGSACTSGSLDPSHVLLAIGLPAETAHGSVRLTINEKFTIEDINYIIEKLTAIIQKLRQMSLS